MGRKAEEIMSEKCKFCGGKIFDENGQDYGFQMANGEWVCFDDECLLSGVENRDMQLTETQKQLKQVEANYDALQTPMPCGHLARYAVNGEDGTQYCCMCALEAERENQKTFIAELEVLRNFVNDVKETCELEASHMVFVKTIDIPLLEKRLNLLKETL
jgi:hypothetical protein